jgi:outer membrane protein assembly factor BamB
VNYTPAIDRHELSPLRHKSRRHPAVGLVGTLISMAIGAAGCQVTTKAPTIGPVPANSFVQQWAAPVPSLKNDPVASLYLRGDTLYAYSKNNQVYGFSASGGGLSFADQVVGPTATLRAPSLLPEGKVVFPAADTLEEYDKAGRKLCSLPLDKPTHSPGVAVGYMFYVGLDSPTGGRLAALDLTPRVPTAAQVKMSEKLGVPLDKELNRAETKWEVLTIAGIQSTPVYYQGIIYVGDVSGKVWAINEQGSGIWSLPDGSHNFKADGPIHADLRIDEAGLYVASEDGNLYCVDRGNGRIRWTYYGGTPLDVAPVLSTTAIYQYVPGTGLVAIDKRSSINAKTKWVNDKATTCLSEDSHYVYALGNDGRLMALDKTDGHTVFRGVRKDIPVFATAEAPSKTPTIYAATSDGTVISVGPMLMPGTMGELVYDTIPSPFQVCLLDLN